jgi:HEAT repeat protein
MKQFISFKVCKFKMNEINWEYRVKDLIQKLQSDVIDTKQQAAWELHKLAEDKISETKLAIHSLREAIKDENWAVRKMSILALGELNVSEDIPTIIDFLMNDTNTEVRIGSAEALGDMKAVEAIPYLLKTMEDSADMLRHVSTWSIGKIGIKAKEAVPKLIEYLKKPDEIGIVQINRLAAWALGMIGDKRAIEPLIEALNNIIDHEMKFTIAYSLTQIEGKKGIGFAELQKMKENYELDESELELLEKLENEI